MNRNTLSDLEKEIAAVIETKTDEKIDDLVNSLQEETPVDSGEAQAGWYRDGDAIHNDVEHIDDLNQGTSQQAPRYFIEKTLLSQPGVNPSGTIVRPK